jgi:hypothetical protein
VRNVRSLQEGGVHYLSLLIMSALVEMDAYLHENFDGVYLATVEGPPGCDAAI